MANKLNGESFELHGLTGTYEYNIWAGMLYRCRTNTSHLYDSYGGRGINVCDRWIYFENFIADMGERPSMKHSLDRVDVNGDYCPENCVWATHKEQARNRRNSRTVTVADVVMQVDDYCERFGVSKHAIKNRIRRGWSNDRIVNTPVRSKK